MSLRRDKGSIVREYRDGKDSYQDAALPAQLGGYELDHVLELQVVRDCFDKSDRRIGVDYEKKRKGVLFDVREAANVNFTTKVNNEAKSSAVREFQNASSGVGGASVEAGFLHFLSEESGEGPAKISRKVSQRIHKSTYKSGYALIDALQTDECPVKEAMVDELSKNLVAMKLK